jgi:hypothetical protein
MYKPFVTSLLFLASAIAVNAVSAAPPGIQVGTDATLSSSSATDAKVNEEKRRAALKQLILEKWAAHVQETYQVSGPTWSRDMEAVLAASSTASLEKAAKARNFIAMDEALIPTGRSAAPDRSKLLGDTATDLVFVPVTPCRIADTRLAGGQIAANTVRSFDVTAVSDYSFQGGASSNCGVGAAGSFAAAAFNFTVVTPTAAGYITAYPFLGTQPLAATVNYTAGDIRGNFAIVKLDQGASANELSVYSFAATHLVIDIVGYFTTAEPPDAQCVDTASTSSSVPAGGTDNVSAPACAAGYLATATNCESSSWQMPMVYFKGGTCSAQNNGSSAATLRASRTCCRMAGR